MEGLFREEIETRQVDMFFANEMGRQIHRYIKAMHGSLAMLEKFEARMKTLTVPQREEAMARYIDLNRKVVKDLSWRCSGGKNRRCGRGLWLLPGRAGPPGPAADPRL